MNKEISIENFKKGVFEFKDHIETIKFDEAENLLLNMSGGLLPEYLSDDEVKVMIARYGENWFEDMGYTEPMYKKPAYYNQEN